MINAVTTNKTDFFREPGHFTFLTKTVLPEFADGRAPNNGQRFTVWSAGCSSGEEPYTLAIVLSEFAEMHPILPFSITATDISTRVLDMARLGIYDEDQTAVIPAVIKQKYFMRSKDREKGLIRVALPVRALVQFLRLNLMDDSYPFREGSVNAIFCRNVMIYFDRETQRALLGRFCRYLQMGGYLFLGHSETIYGFELPLVRIASTIYRKIL
jgi:chemotaxis protein methyltransferase CheR